MRGTRRFLLLIALTVLARGARAATYQVTAIPSVSGMFTPTDVNDSGEVAGNFSNSPALWLPQAKYGLPTGLNNLATQPGYSSTLR